jgi:alkylation response protein AidB-like acyl-CoA dehydrogenase
MATQIDAARLMMYRAAWMKDREEDNEGIFDGEAFCIGDKR